MSDGMAKKLVSQQRSRTVAGILSWCESRSWYRQLSQVERDAFRERLFSQIGIFYDLVLDIIKVGDEDGVRNEQVLELLQRLHQGQRRLEDRINGS
jgi:hypothetical protein